MRKVIPYKTLSYTKSALDNGGRFYNLFTKQDDDIVDTAELAKAAGVFSASENAFLYFEMATINLKPRERVEILSKFSQELLQGYTRMKPTIMLPSTVEAKGRVGRLAIVSGYTRYVENKTQFVGFVLIPAGKTFILVPIMDRFDVYEVFDSPESNLPHTVIATLRGSWRIPDWSNIRFGGVLKKISFEDKTKKKHGLYLDTQFYTPLLPPQTKRNPPMNSSVKRN